MATKTFEELKQLAIQIRDEKTNKQNTATRVGTAMLEHINKLEQDYYDKTNIDEQSKNTTQSINNLNTKIDKRTTEYNVSVNHPTSGTDGTNRYDLAGAIAQVPAEAIQVFALINCRKKIIYIFALLSLCSPNGLGTLRWAL